MKKDIKNIIDGFKNRKILVVGDAVLDAYVHGSTDRICREAPVPVFNLQDEKFCCGGAANTAINLAALGAETYFLTVIGKDAHAKEMVDILQKHHVHCEYILKDKTRKTIAKKRVIASSSILLRIDEGSVTDINQHLENKLLQNFFEAEDFVDAIVLSDYGFGVITDSFIQSVKRMTSTFSKPVIVDSKNLTRFKNLHATSAKPNYEEYLKVVDLPKVSKAKRVEQVFNNREKLLENSGAASIAVTLDEDGVALVQKEKKNVHFPCIPRDQKNTIGAGDTFISALTLGIASGLTTELSTEIAAAAAAIVVQKDGTTLCSNMQLQSYFNAIPEIYFNNRRTFKYHKRIKRRR